MRRQGREEDFAEFDADGLRVVSLNDSSIRRRVDAAVGINGIRPYRGLGGRDSALKPQLKDCEGCVEDELALIENVMDKEAERF